MGALVNQLLPIKRALRQNTPSQNNLTTMGKVIGHIGKTGHDMAALAIPDLIELCNKSNNQNLPVLLKEIESEFSTSDNPDSREGFRRRGSLSIECPASPGNYQRFE